MLVDDIRLEARDEQWELSGRVTMDRLDTEGLRLWFRFPNEYSTGELDASPFLPVLLVTAMWWNEKLIIDGPVSARLLAHADRAIAAYRCLNSELPSIPVAAPSCAVAPGTTATACFFSRGIDSWYSVLSNLGIPSSRPPLTHLVYVPSIDFMYSEENRARSIAATRNAAEDVGCELVVLDTNVRRFTERFQHFGITFGGVLSGVGLALGGGFSHVLLASSVPISAPNHSGSEPSLDRLWSTERTTIVHDGALATRLDKTRSVASHRQSLKRLKVCFVEDTTLNCGRCEKCLLTMIELHIAGALDACPAFERPLDPRAVARIPDPGWQSFFFHEALDALGEEPFDVALRLAVEKVLLRSAVRASVARTRRLAATRLAPLRTRFGL